MKKQQYLAELDSLHNEALNLLDRSELDLKSAKFLGAEADKLMAKMDDDTLPYDEKERVAEELAALLNKLEYEKKLGGQDEVRMKAVLKRLDELKVMMENNLLED